MVAVGDSGNGAELGAEPLEDLGPAHHLVARPPGRSAHVHVLDEPDLGAVPLAERDQVGDLVVVEPPDDDRVELDALEPGATRGRDPRQHVRVPAAPGELLHPFGTQRVEAHGDAPQPGGFEGRGEALEQHAVRREGEVGETRLGVQHRDQRCELVTQQRLAAGEPNLGHTQPREHASNVSNEDLGSQTYSASGMQ